MSDNGILSVKEKELIALSASVAAGCQPCTEHHVKASHEAGACDRGVTLAIDTALQVRASATQSMADWARHCQPVQPELGNELREKKQLLVALAGVAAAAAVNSVPDLQARSAAALKAGATSEQIRTAIGIAQSIQRVAIEKVSGSPVRAESAASPCCTPSQSAPPASGCGCH